MTAHDSRDDAQLVLLMEAVVLARSAVQRGRALPANTVTAGEQTRRMQDLARALEEFADGASSAGVPLPYRYRDEIRLYQALYPYVARRSNPTDA